MIVWSPNYIFISMQYVYVSPNYIYISMQYDYVVS